MTYPIKPEAPRFRLLLRGQEMLHIGRGHPNAHQLSLHSGISYPTVARYVNTPGEVRAYDRDALPAMLIDGQGLSPSQVLELRIGDIFDLVEIPPEPPK